MTLAISVLNTESGSGDAIVAAPATTGSAATPTAHTPTDNTDNSMIGDGTQVAFTDELIPSECLVKLDSLAPANSKARPLFAVHAIEGFVTAIKPLAAKLNVPVYGLQCTIETPIGSINELAKYYIEQIKTVQAKGPYVIVGYSFGASVAFEMVSELEAAGEKATLVMLDGAPKYVSFYTETHKHRSEADAQAIAYFGMVVGNLHFVSTVKELAAYATFDLRLKRLGELVAEKTKFKADDVEVGACVFYKKLYAAHHYKPERKLQTANVTLVKPTENYVKLGDDYGLSEVS